MSTTPATTPTATTAKTPAESRVEMTELAMPTDANNLGTVFGGRIVQWMDLAGAMSARRHARTPVVTAAMDQLTFQAPVRLGHVAILQARVNAAFGSSMEVEVEVFDEHPDTGVRRRCCDGFLTFVSLGKDNRPAPVAPIRPETPEEVERERAAHERRKWRLATRPAR